MKLVCSQSDLNTNLSLAARAVPARPTHPVLGNILLIADEQTQQCRLRAFDLSLGIQTVFPATVREGGIVTLPAKLLGDIVSRLNEGEIEIVDAGTEAGADSSDIITLVSTSGRYQLRSMDAEEFPELPQVESPQTLMLPVETLIEGLRLTLFAASIEESKQVLTGVHLVTRPMELEFAATDGHRLAVVSLEMKEEEGEPEEGEEGEQGSRGAMLAPGAEEQGSEKENSTAELSVAPQSSIEVTIPARALRELDRLLNAREGTDVVTLNFDDSQVAFELQHRRLTSRKLEGAYPAYDQLIPKQFSLSMTADRKQLIAALERVAVLTDSKNHVVKFSLECDKHELELSVDTIDVGRAREFIPVQISGDSIEVAFNVKYLMDGLKALPTAEIQMQMNTPKQPVIFTPLGGVKMTYLVMPVQLRD